MISRSEDPEPFVSQMTGFENRIFLYGKLGQDENETELGLVLERSVLYGSLKMDHKQISFVKFLF